MDKLKARHLVTPLALLLFFFSAHVFSDPLKVMIDAGHGGSDTGTAHHKLVEKDITLAVALKLQKLLQDDSRFLPVMTRSSDVFIGLDDRKVMAEKSQVDAFVSIHVNSSPTPKAGGTEIYFENQIPSDEESLFLANRENSSRSTEEQKPSDTPNDVPLIINDLNRSTHMNLSSLMSQKILESFQSTLKIKTRSLRQAPFRVLGVSMAATLIELGFLTNAIEAKKLSDPQNQQKMAKAIYLGLVSYKQKRTQIEKPIAQKNSKE